MNVLRAKLAMLLCAATFCAHATDTWMTVMLDGRKVGNLRIQRDMEDGNVVTRQTLNFRLTRVTTPLATRTELRSVESTSGAPLAFYAKTSMSAQDSVVEGERRTDGAFQVANTVGGQSTVNLLAWPVGASLAEGQRLATVRHGFMPGTRYPSRNFDPVKQQVATMDVTVLGDDSVDLPRGKEHLHHLRQVLSGSNGSQWADTWVDDNGYVRRALAPLLGFHLEMAACDEACATAPDQDIDLLRAAMIEAPRPMTANLRAAPVRYLMQVRGDHPHPFIDTDEQHVAALGDGVYQLDVGFAQARATEPGPTADDTASNPWVQSDNAEIRAMARAVVGDARTDVQRMRRLRSWLSDYIVGKGLDVGYASALETLHDRRGDCTEHAVLLTAMARSLGIPARVVTGVVYAERFGGASRVFIPHAWTQAWLQNRWVSFDSAQRRYDATHIALGVGNGDPWRFFAAMGVLGNLRMLRATPASGLMDLPAPSMGAEAGHAGGMN